VWVTDRIFQNRTEIVFYQMILLSEVSELLSSSKYVSSKSALLTISTAYRAARMQIAAVSICRFDSFCA
jgi:hypothetical protein